MAVITKKLKSLLIIALSVILVTLLAAAIFGNHIMMLVKGMPYIVGNVDDYQYSYYSIDDELEFTIDLYNIESNSDKIIYENEGCKIKIDRVIVDHEQRNGREFEIYRIIFRSIGKYSLRGATLISGIVHEVRLNKYTNELVYSYNMGASMKCEYNGKTYDSKVSGVGGFNYKGEDEFAFYLFPSEAYEGMKYRWIKPGR